MRIRTIKPEFCTSEQLAECSTSARLLFVLMWCFCDDGGVHIASPKRLKMEVFPGDAFSDDEISDFVTELIEHGLLIEYESQGQLYWHVTGWNRHQKIDKPTIRFPSPDDKNSTTIRRGLVEYSATPPPRNGREGNGEEGNGFKDKEKENSRRQGSESSDGKSNQSQRKQRFNPLSVPIPEPLCSDPAFAPAWAMWIEHRQEIGKRLTEKQSVAQLRQFSEWGAVRAIAAIQHTVTKGWQGIREPDLQRNGNSGMYDGINQFLAESEA